MKNLIHIYLISQTIKQHTVSLSQLLRTNNSKITGQNKHGTKIFWQNKTQVTMKTEKNYGLTYQITNETNT